MGDGTRKGCGRPEANPMVEVNGKLPSLAGQRFHAACFREALAEALLELEARGVVAIERQGEAPGGR